MSRTGLSSMFFHEYPLDMIFSGIAAAGFDTMEFWLETPAFWTTGRDLQRLEAEIQKHPSLAPITVHAPTLDLNPVSINPDVAEISVASACAAIAEADRLQAEVITIHPGRRTAKRPPNRADMRRFTAFMEAVEAASRHLRVAVAIENMEPRVNSLLTTPEAVREVLDNYPHLSLTFDYAHACRGGEGTPLHYWHLCSDRIVNVHASRASSGEMHLPLQGTEDMHDLASLLAAFQYDGPVIFEIEDLSLPRKLGYLEKCMLIREELLSFQRSWERQLHL